MNKKYQKQLQGSWYNENSFIMIPFKNLWIQTNNIKPLKSNVNTKLYGAFGEKAIKAVNSSHEYTWQFWL